MYKYITRQFVEESMEIHVYSPPLFDIVANVCWFVLFYHCAV